MSDHRRWNRNPARSRIQSDKHSPGSLQRNRAPGALSTTDRYPSVFDTSVHCHSLQAHMQFLLSPDRGWYTHRSSQFPDQRVRSQHIDGTGSIFLLQIMRCCNRSRQKVRACCRDAQLCKFFPVICYAHRRIICDKHIISTVLGQSV